jgi:hypothetical protein
MTALRVILRVPEGIRPVLRAIVQPAIMRALEENVLPDRGRGIEEAKVAIKIALTKGDRGIEKTSQTIKKTCFAGD